MISRLWTGFRKLHLPLYLLFIFMLGLGSLTSGVFEKYSLIDVRLLETELAKLLDAKAHHQEYRPPKDVVEKIFKPLKAEEQDTKRYRYVRGKGLEAVQVSDHDVTVNAADDVGGRFVWLLLLWLWPLYRYHFSRKKPDPKKVEGRIIGLPAVIFALVWAVAIYRYFVKTGAYASQYGPPDLRIKTIFAVSSLLYGAFVSFLNLELTQLYIRRFIAKPYFQANNPYGIKRGFAIDLTLRYALMVFSLAMVPLVLSLYVPVSFNMDVIKSLRHGPQWELFYQRHQALIPCLIVAMLVGVLLPFQMISILLFKWNVHSPIRSLVQRMRAVAEGDFSCKTSVFYSDEIGQLKGHFNLMLDGLVEREKIKDTFGKYVSIEIAEKIMKSGQVNLAGEEIQATVLFSDIRNFTPLSEKLPPTELIRFLNDYFSHITRPIAEHQGVINKFMGDAVMAVFSPVFGVQDHADAAVRAALGMRRALAEFNAQGRYEPVSFGVGVHTGSLVAGNVGTESRLEYTVIGDTVNVASRVESQTKQFAAEILVSEAVWKGIDRGKFPGLEFTACGPVLMKGKSRPLLLYKIAPATAG